MGSTFRYLGIADDADLVLDWFQRLPQPPTTIENPGGVMLYFPNFGPLAYQQAEAGRRQEIDIRNSPLVSVFLPSRKRGILWTAGEVHFLPDRQRFRPLSVLDRTFRGWLAGFPQVFGGRRAQPGAWDYYLEGSLRNYDTPIHALPRAFEALRVGQYFVGESDGEQLLERLCRSLRHRGVEGITDA
jgi:hypothetical protein